MWQVFWLIPVFEAFPLSVVSYQLSVISCQLFLTVYRLPFTVYRSLFHSGNGISNTFG